MKRPSREGLVKRALAVIHDAINRCQSDGPLTGEEPGLRLALALLYAIASDETDFPQPTAAAFVELWNAVTGRPSEACGDKLDMRPTWARTQLSGIARRVGAIDLLSTSDPRHFRMRAEARKRCAELIRQISAEADDIRRGRRRAVTCEIDRPGRKR